MYFMQYFLTYTPDLAELVQKCMLCKYTRTQTVREHSYKCVCTCGLWIKLHVYIVTV